MHFAVLIANLLVLLGLEVLVLKQLGFKEGHQYSPFVAPRVPRAQNWVLGDP